MIIIPMPAINLGAIDNIYVLIFIAVIYIIEMLAVIGLVLASLIRK